MPFDELPLVLALIGLVLYTVLAGADFGAGLWQLTAGQGRDAVQVRDYAHHAIAPVWEANHVWLIFVITVVWTAYPTAFGSIASTLALPLFVAAIGIIFRGTAYALDSATSVPAERRVIETVFAVSSILTPFMLGAAVGAIASRRVPVGNAAGNLVTSWLNPTSALVGVLAVAVGAYLSAVYLSADAVRRAEPDLERRFRSRALSSGAVAGVLAVGGIAVLHADAPALYAGLTGGAGLAALIVSCIAGAATLALVWRRRYEAARYCSALAVAAIIGGWALAQRPVFLPGLTVSQAAASRDVLIAVVVATAAGAVILFPSLALLFGLVLRGRFDPGRAASEVPVPRPVMSSVTPGLLARAAGAGLVVGIGLLTVAGAEWAHAVGVTALVGSAVAAFVAVAPADPRP